MSDIFFGEPSDTGEIATISNRPHGLAEDVAKGWEAGRRVVNLNKTEVLEEEAFRARIAAIEKATGEKLPNPLTDRFDEVDYDALEQKWRTADPRVNQFVREKDQLQRQAFEKRAAALRQKYPGKDIPTLGDMRAGMKARAQDLEVELAEAGWAGFVGAAAAGFTDPINLATLPVGASAKTILGAAVKTGAVNMGIEAAVTPLDQAQRAELGLDTGPDVAATNIALAGVFGAAFGAGGEAAGHLFGKLTRRRAIEEVAKFEPSFHKAPEVQQAMIDLERELAGDEAAGLDKALDVDVAQLHAETLDAIERAAPAEIPQIEAPGVARLLDDVAPDERAPMVRIDGQDFETYDGHHAALLQLAIDRKARTISRAEAEQRAQSLLPAFKGLVIDGKEKLIDDAGGLVKFADEWLQRIRSPNWDDRLFTSEPMLESGAARAAYLERLRESRNAIETGTAPSDDGVFDPATLLVDAKRFQFKAGGDAEGVTDALKGVKKFDPIKAGDILVWEDKSGKRFVADGHQRTGLARRLAAEGHPPIRLRGFLLKEIDGITDADARAIAAAKNIAQGSGSALDAAKVLKVKPELLDGSLNPRSALVQQAEGLMKLSDDALGMVINEVVPEHYGALVGKFVADPKEQLAVMGVLARNSPANLIEAEALIRQAQAAGFTREVQKGLFGDQDVAESLLAQRAAVLSRAVAQLRRDKRIFSTLTEEADTIEGVGNKLLAKDQNREIATNAAEIADVVLRTAHLTGPVADALNRAARHVADGGHLSKAVKDFVAELRGIGPQQLRGLDPLRGRSRGDGGAAQAAAPGGRAAPEAADLKALDDFDDPAAGGGVETQRDDLTVDMFGDAIEPKPKPKEGADGKPKPAPEKETPPDAPQDVDADELLLIGEADGEAVVKSRRALKAEYQKDEEAIARLEGCVRK